MTIEQKQKAGIILYFEIDDIFFKIHSLLRLIFFSSSSSKNLKRERGEIQRRFCSSSRLERSGTPQKNSPIKFNLISVHRARFLFLYTHTRYIESRKHLENEQKHFLSNIHPMFIEAGSPFESRDSPLPNKYYPLLLGPKSYSSILQTNK